MTPEDIGKLVLEHKWYALAALLIGLVIRLLNEDTKIPITIPGRWKAPLALALGIVAGLFGKLAGGSTWTEAFAWGLGAAVAAIMGHVFFIKSAAGGKEVPLPGLTRDPIRPPPLPMLFMIISCAAFFVFSILGCTKQQEAAIAQDLSPVAACVLNRAQAGEEPLAVVGECSAQGIDAVVKIVETFLAARPPHDGGALAAAPDPLVTFLAKAKVGR